MFGTGSVRTPDDFGTRGDLLTHRELLDHLPVEFSADGWNVKRLLRKMVLSSTYQQSSQVGRELRVRDPDNCLLARGSRFRLSAEEIRDAALTALSLLSRTIGGRSIYPYQPAHFYPDKEDDANEWRWPEEDGPELYRRGLYTFIRRTSPYPSLQAFDVAGRGECTVARPRNPCDLAGLRSACHHGSFKALYIKGIRQILGQAAELLRGTVAPGWAQRSQVRAGGAPSA